MHIPEPPTWPTTEPAALAEQRRLRALLRPDADGAPAPPPRLVTGVDVSYETAGDRLAAAAVTVDLSTLDTVETATATGVARFPYVPGLLAFRELPTLLVALRRLERTPDLILCDGHGLAHPRGFGLACHLGVLTGTATAGVAKNAPWPLGGDDGGDDGDSDGPGPRRGDGAPIRRDGRVVGRVLRTQDGVKPVYVSAGHLTGLDAVCRTVLALTPEHRQPETTRRADRLSREVLRASVHHGRSGHGPLSSR